MLSADKPEVNVSHNQISPWWKHMRNILGESESISAALLAALVARTVASDICNGHKVIIFHVPVFSTCLDIFCT